MFLSLRVLTCVHTRAASPVVSVQGARRGGCTSVGEPRKAAPVGSSPAGAERGRRVPALETGPPSRSYVANFNAAACVSPCL